MGRGAEGAANGGGDSSAAALLRDSRFQPFLHDNFDCAGFASAALAHTGVTAVEQTAELQTGIRLLGDQIRDEVNTRYDELLSHSRRLHDAEASLQGVRLGVESLRSAVSRVTGEVMEPFQAVLTKTHQLANLHETADLLRHSLHRLKLAAKLRQQLAASKSGTALDLAKAAKFLTDIKLVGEEADLSGIEVLAADDEFLAGAEKQVVAEAEAALAKGMSTLSQAEVGSALQVYYNLHQLQPAVLGLLSQYNLALSKRLGAALDAKKINAAARAAAGAAAGSPGLSGSASTEEMWSRLGKFGEELHGCAVAVWHLQRVLAKKRDPLTHQCFMDLFLERGGLPLMERFWRDVTELLRQRMSEAAGLSRASGGGRDFVRDAISQGYPRFALLLETTVVKLVRDTDIKGTAAAAGQMERDNLLDATGPFLDMYLAASSRKLGDAVMATFPGGATRAIPSAADVQKLVGRLHDELKSAGSSETLSVHMSHKVGEALVLLAERASYMAAAGSELRQLGGSCNAAQARNISLCCALQEVHRAIVGLLPRLLPPVADCLRAPLEELQVAAVETVTPVFRAGVEAAEQRILSIHKDSFGQESQAYETASSPFLDDLTRLLVYFRTEFLSRFTPPPSPNHNTFISALVERMACRVLVFFVRHASLMRGLSQAGKLRLTKDMAELEAAVSSNLFPVEHLGTPYRMLRAFRPLLFQETSALLSSPLLKELPAPVVLHHLYSRAPPQLQSPLEQGGLTPAQWSLWLDQHTGVEAVTRISSALNSTKAAAAAADTEGIIPIMLQICEAKMQKS
jgi:hypothetical protein